MKQIADTLVFVLDPLPKSIRKEPVLIPYKHFPSSIEPSEVQRLLHWVFSICGLRIVKTDEFGFWLDFSSQKIVEDFYKYKESINRRYSKLPKEEPATERLSERTEELEEKKFQSHSPETLIKNDMGYFKFNKQSKGIPVGGKETRHFRLLRFFCDPIGVERTLESVFEAIRLTKDREDSKLQDLQYRDERKKALIRSTQRELQGLPLLKGRLKFKFNKRQKTYQMEIP